MWQWRSMDYWRPEWTAILASPKNCEMLDAPMSPHFAVITPNFFPFCQPLLIAAQTRLLCHYTVTVLPAIQLHYPATCSIIWYFK